MDVLVLVQIIQNYSSRRSQFICKLSVASGWHRPQFKVALYTRQDYVEVRLVIQ